MGSGITGMDVWQGKGLNYGNGILLKLNIIMIKYSIRKKDTVFDGIKVLLRYQHIKLIIKECFLKLSTLPGAYTANTVLIKQ